MNIIRSLFEFRIQSISITIDRTNQTFFPGELITGRLNFSSNESIEANNVKLLFIGIVNTHIRNSDTLNNHHHRNQYRRHSNPHHVITNSYVSQTVNNPHEQFELFHLIYSFLPNSKFGPGDIQIPFQFTVPINIPSSYKNAPYAYIEYSIKGEVGGKSKKIDVNIMGFPSISPNELYAPVQDQQTKTVGIFNGKQLTMRCSINKSGWTLGDNVTIDCFIDNHSDKSMLLCASLYRDIRITAYSFNENFNEKITTTFGQQVPSNSINGRYQVQLLLPKDLPIIQNTCRTIQIQYYIQIKLDIPFALNLHCKLPIILTNQQLNPMQPQQPMTNYYPQQQPSFAIQPPVNPVAYPNNDIPSAPPIGFMDAPPPPYSEEFASNSQQPIAQYPTLPTKN